jgi:hypothetical protein
MIPSPRRHMSRESFREYLTSPVPIDHPIHGTPRIILFFDPVNERIGLRMPSGNASAPPTGLEHVSTRLIHHDGGSYLELAVTDPRLFPDAYPLLCGVADRIQIDGLAVHAAIVRTLRQLGNLLRAEDILSRESETGLIGELAILKGLIDVYGPGLAVGAWRGGDREEHDFGLLGCDIEVKTTAGERRAHWISSLTQLVRTGERPLYLVSVQLTRAGADGVTVAQIIERLRGSTGDARDIFEDRLQDAGWRERYATSSMQQWRARSAPVVFTVDDDFPRLTPALLTAGGVDLTVVTDVRYRIDLTGCNAGQTIEPQIAATAAAAHRELT